MTSDPALRQDADDLVAMLASRPRLLDVFVRVRGRALVIGVETLDMRARTLWRAKSLMGGFYEFQIHLGRNRFMKVRDCTRLEELAEAIERSWSTYLRSGRLV